MNRQITDPKTGKWWEGPNREGPSDKTVAVLKFESLSGEPLAVYYNYAVHGVIAGQLDQVSGDIPGASSRYIEDASGGSVVAVWSTGASGDQNPIYFQQTYDLREIRIKDYAKRGVDISNAMPPGGQGLDRNDAAVARLMNQQRQMLSSMGQFLGEEVLYVMRNIERTETDVRLSGSQKTIQCPGRERTNDGRAGSEGTYKDAGPVEIRLGLLRVGDAMIGAVNAEVFNPIAQRLKHESPFKATMMATLTNGSARSGYIPDDASYGKYTFEVLSSRLRPGMRGVVHRQWNPGPHRGFAKVGPMKMRILSVLTIAFLFEASPMLNWPTSSIHRERTAVWRPPRRAWPINFRTGTSSDGIIGRTSS